MRPYDERLDHLLAQAARVFAEKGYHSTTMRDLAAASGMSLAGCVVVHPGERHAAGGREVAHRGRVIALLRKDPGGLGEKVVEAFVVGAHGFEQAFES